MFIRCAQTVASVSLGTDLVPKDFSFEAAIESLAKEGMDNQATIVLEQLIASGVVEKRAPGGQLLLRFALDPAAEYLAAVRQLFKMKTASQKAWKTYLSALEQMDGYPTGPEGYLAALATCYRTFKKDFSLPDVFFPWERVPQSARSTLVDGG